MYWWKVGRWIYRQDDPVGAPLPAWRSELNAKGLRTQRASRKATKALAVIEAAIKERHA